MSTSTTPKYATHASELPALYCPFHGKQDEATASEHVMDGITWWVFVFECGHRNIENDEGHLILADDWCPRCGRNRLEDRMALNRPSRKDNATCVCSTCGTLEAFTPDPWKTYPLPLSYQEKTDE